MLSLRIRYEGCCFSAFRILRLFFLLLLVFLVNSVEPLYGETDWHPLRVADTSSPRATLKGFLTAWDELCDEVVDDGEYGEQAQSAIRRILSCLNMSEVPPALRNGVAGETAVCLKEVFDRFDLPAWDDIPDSEQLQEDPDGEILQRWRIPDTEITISRVLEGPHRGEYLFDPGTVDRAKEFFLLVQDMPYINQDTPGIYQWYLSDAGWMIPDHWIHALPKWTRHTFWDTSLWKWIGLFVVLCVLILAMLWIYRIGRSVAQSQRETSVLGYFLSLLFPIAAISIPILAKYLVTSQLKLRGQALNLITISLDLIVLLAIIVVVLGISSRIAVMIISHPRIHPKGLDAQFARVTCRLLGLITAVIVFLEGGQRLGIPLTTLLAGAGVGGLAFALAAQDTLKNLFGSMMIFLDKPYRVGERIVTKNYDGVVEEIGLRSTRIRLLTGHQVTIPNEDMARTHIENIGRRPHIRRATSLALRLNTPTEKVQQAVEIVKGLLADHEGMEADFPPRVFFDEFNRDSLRIRILYWYHPPDYWKYVAFGEKLNLRILEALNAEGIELALPTSETHFLQDLPAQVESSESE